MNQPNKQSIGQAAQRIQPYINRTPILTSESLNAMFHTSMYFKCENFQKAGAFKSRGACNAVFSLTESQLQQGVATHSSGNHAQALARAARLRNTNAHIVMPSDSSRVKVEAVRAYGGIITFCVPSLEARESTLLTVIQATGALEIHPYDNLHIIAGQATAALELIQDTPPLHIILAPVGGGGLLSGTAISAHYFSPKTQVWAAEPQQADDAYRSFTQKTFIPSIQPNTIADGLRTSLGTYTFPIILDHVQRILTVSEADIILAMKLIWERMKIIVEPSAAVCLAAIKQHPELFTDKNIGIILSGGNVDLDDLPWTGRST